MRRIMHMLHSLDIEVGDLASTVRSGFKWADLEAGEDFDLCVCTRDPETHEVQGAGHVWDLWFGFFKDVPARLLSVEHEKRSREYTGLLASMRKAYGEDFHEGRPVTVVIYRRDA